jgi:hypothetical protein
MRDKFTRWMIYIAGAVCLYLFLSIRIEPLYNAILQEKILPEYWENTKYGELYYMNNFIRDFREKGLPRYIPKYRNSDKHPKIEDADILIYGDSFMDFSRMVTMPERLADTLHQKVYYQRMIHDHRPMIYLQEAKYSNSKPKVLIYETSELFLDFRFHTRQDTVIQVENRSKFRKAVAGIRDWMFMKDSELKYSVLLQRSILTTSLYSDIATLKFRKFHYITESTPVYSLKYDTPWLFYSGDSDPKTSSFYHHYSDAEIDNICDNISDLAAELKRHYNLDFIFLPIPSKYTICHKLVNDDKYSEFLPKIYAGLKRRGISYINVYDDFNNSKEILYYGTDTHWNKKGMEIALGETLKLLKEKNLIETPNLIQSSGNVQSNLLSKINSADQ